jgi:hypothetical protein
MTSKSLDLCPSSPRHLITKLKGSLETLIWLPQFPPTRHAPLTKKANRGGGTATKRRWQSRPLVGAQMFSLHSLQNPRHRLSGIFQVPPFDPANVPIFVSSVCVFIVQAHLLFPPPLSWQQSLLPFTRPACFVDWLIHYVLNYFFPPDANIMQESFPPALLEHLVN